MIPYTDYECRLKLEEIQRGDCVVIPANEEHAQMMIRVAEFYLEQHRQEVFKALTKEY